MQDRGQVGAAKQDLACRALRGKRYIAYARCACGVGATKKLREQIRLVRQFGNSLKMHCVDEVRLVASGWLPAMRPDLRRLLARKRQKDDYDVLVMEDLARLTRVVPDGIDEIEGRFRRYGVQIVYVSEMARLHASNRR